MKLIVGMTGATGAPLGVALLQALRDMPNVETHLVMSKWAKTTIDLCHVKNSNEDPKIQSD